MKIKKMKTLLPLIALAICGLVVMLERYGVTAQYTAQNTVDFDQEYSDDVEVTKECLVLTDENGDTNIYRDMMEIVFDGMSVGYDVCDAQDEQLGERIQEYQTAVITFEDWGILGDNLQYVNDWVKAGGALMNTVTPQPNNTFSAMSGRLGIDNYSGSYAGINGFYFDSDVMLGAKEGDIFYFDKEDTEKIDVSLEVTLRDDVVTYISSADQKAPILWKTSYGDGTFVILNDAITDRFQRGFLATAYSLLQDASVYPVINASAFYLDDFPSPVPGGNGEYVQRDYGVDIGTFYSTIWWPTVLEWEQRYGIKHTGMIIEVYSDDVKMPYDRNESITQFETFGNMLLNNGGELGLHGYNHMPLCVKGTDEDKKYGTYKLWNSQDDIRGAVQELVDFSSNLFPNEKFQVYVPPSNIMSDSGKEALIAANPDIRVLASTYLPDADAPAYIQEYGVEDNGIIDTPRITSGSNIDAYQKLSELSELNFHYVQSHFMHPDDVLDVDRGAELGWEKLSGDFEDYLAWIYESVPDIRNVTGSEMGVAVQEYDNLSVARSREGNVLHLQLGGFAKEAYLMLCLNEGTIGDTTNCSVTHIAGDHYLIHATADEVSIVLGE